MVTVVWQRFLSFVFGVHPPLTAAMGLAGVVWGVYLLDHWLDARSGLSGEWAPRHQLARDYPEAFTITAGVSFLLAALIAFVGLSTPYLVWGGVAGLAVLAYLSAVHYSPWGQPLRRGGKELAVGAVTAVGVSLPLLVDIAPERIGDWWPGGCGRVCRFVLVELSPDSNLGSPGRHGRVVAADDVGRDPLGRLRGSFAPPVALALLGSARDSQPPSSGPTWVERFGPARLGRCGIVNPTLDRFHAVRIRPEFDSVAPHYWWIERLSFGWQLHKIRTAMLPELATCRTALVVGEGDGRFLVDFLSLNQTVRVDCVDASKGMIALARHRLSQVPGGADRVTFHIADVRYDPLPDRRYDAIVTNFVLDCFPRDELGFVLNRLARLLENGSMWVVGDFSRPTAKWAKPLAELLLWGMYFFFGVFTGIKARRLVDPAPFLQSHNFTLQREQLLLGGFLTSQLWSRRPAEVILLPSESAAPSA